MTDKKGFVLYFDAAPSLAALGAAQRGELLMALFDYAERTAQQSLSPETALSGYPALDEQSRMAFRFMANCIERDTEKWKRHRERRSRGAEQRFARERQTAAAAPPDAERNEWMKSYL